MQMPGLLSRLDRRALLGAGVLAASVALLAAGMFSVLSALTDDPADLPNEGSLEAILEDSIDPHDPSALPGDDDGPPPVPPASISIPRLYIDAPVAAMGVDDNNTPLVPKSAGEVAWYTFSAAPGRGNAVMSGHVDWQTSSGQPLAGVFYRLRELEIGDLIEVTLADGSKITYEVTGNVATAYDDPNVAVAMGPASRDVITLITCGGTWFNDPSKTFGGTYTHRILVRGERVQGLADASLESQ